MNEAIIASVFKREPLWNPSDGLYRNVYVLKKLWKEVGIEVQRDVKTIKARWKNLRAYFYKEHRKVEQPKGGYDPSKMGYSTWQYYDQLTFLKNCVSSERDSNVRVGEDDNETMIYEIPLEEPNFVQSSDSESISSHNQEPLRKKTRTENLSESNDQLLEIETKRLEILQRDNIKEKNDDLLFFESLLPYMNSIPLVRKLRLRSKIQDLILAEIEAEKSKQQVVAVNQ